MEIAKEPRKHWQNVTARILMVLISLAIGLILLEIILRLIGFRPHRPVDILFEPDSELGYSLTGSARQVMETSEARYLVTLKDGRREIPDQTCAPTKSKVSIYAIGDSFCFGQAVDDKDVWINFLTKSIGQSHQFYFYNLGVPGYGPEQYHLRIEKLPRDMGKAAVIYLFFMGNDITSWTLGDFQQNAGKIEFRSDKFKILRWLSYHSAAVWSVCAVAVAYQNRHINSDYFRSEGDFESFKRQYPNWHNTVTLVGDSLATVTRRHGKVLLVVIPNGKQYLSQEGERVARYIGNNFSSEIRKRLGDVAILDLSQHMHFGHQLTFDVLGHFNIRGNRWMAELIEPILIKILRP